MVLTGKACGPAGPPALAPPPHPATRNAAAKKATTCIANFFIIINLLMLPDFRVAHDWIKAGPPPIQIRRMKWRNVLASRPRSLAAAVRRVPGLYIATDKASSRCRAGPAVAGGSRLRGRG